MILLSKKNAIFVGIVLLAIGLRFVNLGKNSYWVDELYHHYVGVSLNSSQGFELPSGYAYPRAKLYAFSVAASQRLFGFNEFGTRAASAFYGVLAVAILFWIAQRLFSFRVAALSAFLLAVIPLELGWARISRFYTLFQVLTILCWFLFLVAIGHDRDRQTGTDQGGCFPVAIRWKALLALFLCFVISLSVQILTALLLLPFFLYFVVVGIAGWMFDQDRRPLLRNRCLLAVLGAAVVFAISYALFSPVRSLVDFALSYRPYWAIRGSAADRFLFLKFMMGKDMFPVGALFVLGFVTSVIRDERRILLASLIFLSQVFLFTFVFSYRMYQYIYNVLPFLVLVAAYFLDDYLKREVESRRASGIASTQRDRLLVPAVALGLLLVFSPFLLRGFRTPFIADGEGNGAVTFYEWKDAARYVNQRLDPESDAVVCTLPLTAMYYVGKIDYVLNMANYDLSRQKGLTSPTGEIVDYYSGRPFICNAEQLRELMRRYKRGFLLLDTYRVWQEQNVPQELHRWIRDHLELSYMTKRKSVVVYSWDTSQVSGESTSERAR